MTATVEPVSPEALPPPAIARRAEDIGAAKAGMDGVTLLLLAVLAGAFIAIGGALSTTVMTGDGLSYGAERLLGGVAFSVGLLLVVLAGAELFTGDNLMAVAWASRRVPTTRLLRVWGIVYVGNMVGAGLTALLVYVAGLHHGADDAVGRQAVDLAAAKVDLSLGRAVALGALCNALVCLAVWISWGARSTVDKAVAVVPAIAAFVAMGFEHSVANMFSIPYALLLQRDGTWIDGLADAPDLSGLGWDTYVLDNLLPVTIGNILGGTLLVALVYWTAYLRRGRAAERSS
jgi:formate transporter